MLYAGINLLVKLQYTTPQRFRMGSALSANKPKQTQNTNPKYEQTQNTNPKYEQTQNTKGFCSPRLQGAVYCNLANLLLSLYTFGMFLIQSNKRFLPIL